MLAGSGGIGTTFKVVEIDSATDEDVGTYVAKAVTRRGIANTVMRAYRLVRSHLGHSGLSTIFQVASGWQDNSFSALMAWIEGEPLSEYVGLLPILAEDLQESSAEALAVRWLRTACHALETLHRNGLAHGDVSPRNIIVRDSDLVLTDYDCITKVGERPASPGTVMYRSPSFAEGGTVAPSDDIYALAASFFHMWFEKPPFQHGNTLAKERGLNWKGVDREAYPVFARFLDRATAPDPANRYGTVAEALTDLRPPEPETYNERPAPLASDPPSRADVEPASVHEPALVYETTDTRAVDGTAPRASLEDTLRMIRTERHQSWKNLCKAVRALLDEPHESFGTPNVAASSKSTVRRMRRETGLPLDRLKDMLDSLRQQGI